MTPSPQTHAHLTGFLGECLTLALQPTSRRLPLLPSEPAYIISGGVSCPEGNWSFTDILWAHCEVIAFLDFLSQRPWGGVRRASFLDPSLTFSTRGTSGPLLNVDVRFLANATPPWNRNPEHIFDGWSIGLFPTESALSAFEESIRQMSLAKR